MKMDPTKEHLWRASIKGIENEGNGYFVETDDILRDGCEDWFIHLSEKQWFSRESGFNFMRALVDWKTMRAQATEKV